MIAELHVLPSPTGDHEQRYAHVDAAIAVIAASGLTYEVGALGTTLEGPPDRVWEVLRAAHEATLAAGADHTMTHVRMFETTDADAPDMASLVGPHR